MTPSPPPPARPSPPGPARRLYDAGLRAWQAHAAFAITAVVLLLAIAGLTYGAHEVYESVTGGTGMGTVDRPVLDAVLPLRGEPLTSVAQAVTTAGGKAGGTVVALVLLAVLWAVRRDWTPVVLVTAAMAGSLLLTSLGKGWVGRVRPAREWALPPYETSPSFPSGHTLNATVLMGIVLYLVVITRRVRLAGSHRAAVVAAATAAALYAVAMGLSRVYLGAHWLLDVAAGWLVGAGWVLAVVLAHRVWLILRPAAERST